MMKYPRFRSLTVWLLAALALGFGSAKVCRGDGSDPIASKAPPPASEGLGPDGALRISPKDHCPVCGMFPARIPHCAAGLRLTDGRTFYFCSNRCLLSAWRHPRRHLGADAQIDRMVVLDYFSGKPLDGLTAWWIAGSDVSGPMGPALVTLESKQDVEAFQRRHGGTRVFKPDQIDASLWRKIMPSDQ